MVAKYRLVYTKQAQRDAKKLKAGNLKKQALQVLKMLEKDPFHNPPRFERLLGKFAGTYSRRINIQHRVVYQVFEKEKIIKIIRMWTHYE